MCVIIIESGGSKFSKKKEEDILDNTYLYVTSQYE
jgi:hypothetical protein